MSITSKSTCTGKTGKKGKKDDGKTPKDDFMDRFYPPDRKICTIIPTRKEEIVDPFYPYRPKTSREYLDYNISQTEAKMDCGPYKIHYSFIRAEYERFPPDYVFPVKKKRKHPQHGRGPVWVFMDEILKAKIEKLQAVYRYEHKIQLRISKKIAHQAKKAMLSKIIENALPAWFHELSNQQLDSVDLLYKAILRDLHYHTICNVQDVIAKIGLVLRPNHLYVEKALKLCCKCPIRFLTLIYLYRRKKRQEECIDYDLNDKILLSSIVHLVLPMILKEMHIRIPSPPPKEPLPPQPEPPKPKKKKYDSPYLEPYTFKRDPPRTGVYKNNHVQYPESPYFIYLREYYLEMYINQLGDEEDLKSRSRKRKRKRPNYENLSPIEIELNHERDGAQREYDELFEGMATPRLLRANVFPKCIIVRPEVEVSIHEESYIEEQEHSEVEAPQPDQPSPPDDAAQDDNVQQDVIDESYEGEGESYEESSEFATIDMAGYCRDHPCCKTKKIYRLPLSKEKGCGKMEKKNVDTKKKGKQKYNTDLDDDFEDYGTESYTDYDSDALPDLSPEENYPMYANVVPICGGIVYHPVYKWVPIITGIIAPDVTCGCNVEPPPKSSKESIELFRRRKPGKVQTGECTCIELFLKRQKKEKEYQKFRKEVRKLCTCKICMCKDRIPRTPSPVPSVPSFIPPSDDVYPKPIPSKLVEIVEPPPFECECKNIVQQRLSHMQHVENEVEDNRKRSYFIADTTDDGKKIIGAIKAPKPCRCLEKYQARVERFEREKRIEFIQRALKNTKKVFFFGGIKLDADGKPIYMIAGVAGAKPCGKCVETKIEEVREEQRKAEMPVLPAGRIQYHISGVRKTPQGNVYIISGTSASEPCNCMKLYDTFVMMHARCMQVYHRYLEKMENDTREYLEEMGSAHTTTSSSSSEKQLGEGQGEDMSSTSTSSKTTSSTTSSSTSPKSSSETSSGSSYDGCTCGPFPKEKIVEEEEAVEQESEEDIEEEEYPCGRYVIVKEIPREREEQIKIIQKVLDGLAIDGFPIADLPGAYKLPHFRIWLALRTKSYYTIKDREDMMTYSRVFWGELDKCHKAYKVPESLNIPDSIARKYTYGQSNFVKKWTEGLKENQYRQIKQTLISHGREFFPSLFAYELPTPTFRDVYFAYVPSKEEALFARFPWAPHEFRNYKQMRERRAAQ
nr:uncharacterized protein LOC111422472 [Onthophagus taurus]